MAKITTGTPNGDIKIVPNGTGKTIVGTNAADATLQSSGDYNLVLQTGNATTGSITITDGANGNIAITPNGTGEVDISKVDIDGGTIDGTDITVGAGKTLHVSAGTLTLADDQISGNKIHGGIISNFRSTGIDDDASSTALTINASDRVGIGYSSPSSKLHVNGTLNGDILKLTGTGVENRGLTVSNFEVSGINGVGVDFDAVGSGGSGGTLSFSTNLTERMRIDGSGDVTMQGSLGVDSITDKDATGAPDFPNGFGSNTVFPAGHVIQTQSSYYATLTGYSIATAKTYVDTDLTISFTPKVSGSTIIAMAFPVLGISATYAMFLRLKRTGPSTATSPVAGGGSNTGSSALFVGGSGYISSSPFIWQDTAQDSTTLHTYTLQVTSNSTPTIYLNRRGADTLFGGTSQIMILEIAQ